MYKTAVYTLVNSGIQGLTSKTAHIVRRWYYSAARWHTVFGHLSRADPCQDHYRALQACIADIPAYWGRRPGRAGQSWLRTVETDQRRLNLGLALAKRRTQDRTTWRRLMATLTLTSPWMMD